MKPTVRKAKIDDVNDIYHLICKLEQCELNKDDFNNIFVDNISNKSVGYFIISVDEAIAGFGSVHSNDLLHHCGKIAEIQELIIDSSYRRLGIGNLLVDIMKNWAKEHGCRHIEVTCNIERKTAQLFYKTQGFNVTHLKMVTTKI